jgi:transcriptional regulator with XRE-family HTH domain
MLTSELIRAARMLLRWDQEILAERSGVPLTTLKKLELREGPLVTRGGTEEKLRSALEEAGVEFLNHGQPGVRMRKQAAETVEALTERIADLKEGLPVVDDEAGPSPQKGMRQLERAHGKNEIIKAKSKRAKLAPKDDQKP